MPRTTPNLRSYLETVTGAPVPFDGRLSLIEARLPLVLRQRYHLEGVRLFGLRVVLAVQVNELEPATPSACAAHVAAIAQLADAPVALVLSGITSAARSRLVQASVPFIVSGSQLFLPMLLVDLRERMARAVPPRQASLSSVAQLVLLTHLQRQRLQQCSLGEIAELLGYSAMMLTKAKDELLSAGLCETRPAGRSLRLVFVAEGRSLWERALPRLSSPVSRKYWVRLAPRQVAAASLSPLASPPEWALRAGISALSDRTRISDDALVTYAASKADISKHRAMFEPVELEEEADARFEAWRYSPHRLGVNGGVDPLSLYLSLCGSNDDRVSTALDELLESVEW